MLEVFVDFDGTITDVDTFDALIRAVAGDAAWNAIDGPLLAGEITLREALARQAAAVRLSRAETLAFMEAHARVDPAFGSPAGVVVFHRPLFTGGRLRGNLKLSKATFEETLANYQKTVQNAFREVSDALIAYQRSQEFFQHQQELTQANRDAAQLAAVRYEGGVVSYLEVLYNEQQLFDTELLLAQARRDELLSVVQLYRALGGGWQ